MEDSKNGHKKVVRVAPENSLEITLGPRIPREQMVALVNQIAVEQGIKVRVTPSVPPTENQ